MTLAIELRSAFGLAVGYRAMVCRRSFIYSLLVSCRWSTSTASSRSSTVRRNPFIITTTGNGSLAN